MFHVKQRPPPVTVVEGDLAIMWSGAPFLFAPGHRMRAARCLVCTRLISGEPATVVGVGALAGSACQCGSIESDMFLLHVCHLPMPPAELQAAIHRGLQCDDRNS